MHDSDHSAEIKDAVLALNRAVRAAHQQGLRVRIQVTELQDILGFWPDVAVEVSRPL
jgi:hypothetical protein